MLSRLPSASSGETPGGVSVGPPVAKLAKSARAAQGNGENSEATSKRGFRKLLAPLLQTGTITREEAGELFRSSGDAKALRTKTEELMKAGKLTRKEAVELYSGAYPENAQRR